MSDSLSDPIGFLLISVLLFATGLAGLFARREFAVRAVCIQLALAAAQINLVVFSQYWEGRQAGSARLGLVFAILAIAVGVFQAVIAVAIAASRRRASLGSADRERDQGDPA